MRHAILRIFLVFFAVLPVPVRAAQSVTEIAPALVLAPREAKSITIQAAPDAKTDIYWQITNGTINGEDCVNLPCIRVYDRNIDYTGETFNYLRSLEQEEAEATITLTNLADTPVTINVQSIIHTCSAEGCAYFTNGEPQEWKVFRIEKFRSVENAKDGSFARISGSSINGTYFDEIFIWWQYDSSETVLECANDIAAWQSDLVNFQPPFILAGMILPSTSKKMVILVDTCMPNGDRFNGAPEDDFDYKAP